MGWRFTHEVEEYASVAAPLLATGPARHTVSLTVISNARAGCRPLEPPELYAWWTGQAGSTTGAVSHTPQFPLLLGAEGPREVVLFTDLANPTSNALYQRLGYRPVTDRAVLRFEPGAPRVSRLR
jgi:hypothetical protein